MESKMEAARNVPDEEKMYRYQGDHRYQRDGGVLYSSIMSPAQNLDAMATLQARPDDLLLVAYPKCGFNWMVSVLRKIIAGSAEHGAPQMPPLIEFLSPDLQKTLKEKPSPRLLGTHVHPDNIPASFTENKTKMLVVFRNPKDTLVSYFHFMNKNPVLPNTTWDAFYCSFMAGDVGWGSYFEHAVAWNKQMDNPAVMVVTFEQLKEDLPAGVRQISGFFGISLTEEQVQSIATATTFSAMKETSQNTHGGHGNIFFRKGEVGDWRNHLTEQQSAEMDQAFQKHLAGTKLGDLLQYQRYC